jgi:hypothetical protein
MKRLLAILAVIGMVLAYAPGTVASDLDEGSRAAADDTAMTVPPGGDQAGGDGDEQDCQGDPHDLGGGFRGSGGPVSQTGLVGHDWIDALLQLYFIILP